MWEVCVSDTGVCVRGAGKVCERKEKFACDREWGKV